MTLGCVVKWAGSRERLQALQSLEGPTQFAGWPDMLHFTSMVYPPSSNSVLTFEVVEMEDFRQPELTEFKISSLGLYALGCWAIKPDHQLWLGQGNCRMCVGGHRHRGGRC